MVFFQRVFALDPTFLLPPGFAGPLLLGLPPLLPPGFPALLLLGLPLDLPPPPGFEKLPPGLPSELRLFLEKDGFLPLGFLDLESPPPLEGLSVGLKA